MPLLLLVPSTIIVIKDTKTESSPFPFPFPCYFTEEMIETVPNEHLPVLISSGAVETS